MGECFLQGCGLILCGSSPCTLMGCAMHAFDWILGLSWSCDDICMSIVRSAIQLGEV